jgi:pimeloyl-ACP methyl ester carboxylesterase
MASQYSKFDTEGFERWVYKIGGVDTVLYTIGHGLPVMYWHGGGTWHGFAWARAWKDRFKVILTYHPGFGESGDDPQIGSMDDFVQHYIELCDAMGLRRFALIGTSFGGYMATAFTIAHPSRVAKLALAAPGGIFDPAFPMGNFRETPPEKLADLFVVDKSVVKDFLPDRWNERIAREGQYAGKGFGPSTTSGPKLLRHMPRVTMPTLVVWGKQDRVLPVGLATHWAKAIPHATVRVIDNAGHLLLDESQEARDAVAGFIG